MMDYNDELKAIWNSKPEHREITCKVCRYDFDTESYERHAKICNPEILRGTSYSKELDTHMTCRDRSVVNMNGAPYGLT